jgi:hypothetical protein
MCAPLPRAFAVMFVESVGIVKDFGLLQPAGLH